MIYFNTSFDKSPQNSSYNLNYQRHFRYIKYLSSRCPSSEEKGEASNLSKKAIYVTQIWISLKILYIFGDLYLHSILQYAMIRYSRNSTILLNFVVEPHFNQFLSCSGIQLSISMSCLILYIASPLHELFHVIIWIK